MTDAMLSRALEHYEPGADPYLVSCAAAATPKAKADAEAIADNERFFTGRRQLLRNLDRARTKALLWQTAAIFGWLMAAVATAARFAG